MYVLGCSVWDVHISETNNSLSRVLKPQQLGEVSEWKIWPIYRHVIIFIPPPSDPRRSSHSIPPSVIWQETVNGGPPDTLSAIRPIWCQKNNYLSSSVVENERSDLLINENPGAIGWWLPESLLTRRGSNPHQYGWRSPFVKAGHHRFPHCFQFLPSSSLISNVP